MINLDDLKKIRNYLLKFYTKSQISSFCEVSDWEMTCITSGKRKVSEEKKERVYSRLIRLKSLMIEQAKKGGFEYD